MFASPPDAPKVQTQAIMKQIHQSYTNDVPSPFHRQIRDPSMQQ